MATKVTLSVDTKFLKRTDAYARQVERLYDISIKEAVRLALSISGYDKRKPFTWSHYPETQAGINKLVKKLCQSLQVTVDKATEAEWLGANLINDTIVEKFFKHPKLRSIPTDHYRQRNLEALASFQQRKVKGMQLSERIWNLTDQFKNDLEMCLDIGLGEGKSAAELSRDVRQYLQQPKQLYRRIKNKESGVYYLSQNAKKYNPETGQYRSSYKNAMRLTRTETNMAYRSADMERWSQMNFVVGYEILRSNNVNACPICIELAGKYPPSFKWSGWHPQCRCKCVAILATADEFLTYQKSILAGDDNAKLVSTNEVKDIPEVFIHWIRDNQERISLASSQPYFLKENKAFLKNKLKLAI